MTSSQQPTPDPDSPPVEVDVGLAYVFGEDTEPDTPSVLEHIAARTGSSVRIALRDADVPGETPMLRPLGSDDPRQSGKYVVQGELGRGGVGAVHRGHDQELGRDVALKFLLEKYRDDPEILQRFVEEAQIGGQLQHPGIVPVYDLGMVKGRPFFAMKLVKGDTLAKRLAGRESPVSDRQSFLSIFEAVCQTMAYAHARGVVHRDLKPANVMIGAFGEVQVVDWGVGKVLRQGGVDDERLAESRSAAPSVIETVRSKGNGSQSLVGSVMGTPAYMPPEQAHGKVEEMDERSDVFALGAILCEILTGKPPYVGERSQLIGMAAAADLDDARERLATCGADPELTNLATHCLQPAPTSRPRNAEVVARAIHDHLAGTEARLHDARVEAAEARVRAAAFRRTQTLGLGLTAAIAAGLVASLWLWRDADAAARSEKRAHDAALVSALDAKQNEERAELELARAVEIKRLITDMLQSVTPEEAQLSDTTLMKGLLDKAALRLEQGAIQDELVAADLHDVVGDTYRILGLYDQAERHLPKALEIRRRILGEGHHDTLSAMTAVAHLQYARGRYDEAEQGLARVLELHECEAGLACPVPRLAQVLLASTVQGSGRFDEAETIYLEVQAVLDRELGEEALEAQESRLGLGMLYFQSGRLDEAERVLRQTLKVAEGVLGEQHPHTLRTERSLASLHREAGHYDEALRLLRECVAVGERVWGPEHAETLLAKQDLALVYLRGDDRAEAEPLLLETLASHERVLGKEHPETLAVAANLGAFYLESGRFDEAEARFRAILEIQRRVLGEEHPGTLGTMINLATIGFQRGRLDEAESLCEEVIEKQERILGAEHPETLHSKWVAASILATRGRYEEAEVLLHEVLEVRRRVLGADHPDTLVTMETLATGYERMGDLDEAEALFALALDGWNRLAGEQHPQALFVAVNLALVQMAQGREDEAEAPLAAALEGLKRTLGVEHPNTLIAIGNVGCAYSEAGRHEDAVATLEPNIATMRRVFGDGDERVSRAVEHLARSYLALGRREGALPLAAELLALDVSESRASDDPEAINNTAWLLLTHELEELRDADQALALAERACTLEENRTDSASLWMVLDTLALAQHRTGDTVSAVATARRALSVMPEGADDGVAWRLAEYEAALEDR